MYPWRKTYKCRTHGLWGWGAGAAGGGLLPTSGRQRWQGAGFPQRAADAPNPAVAAAARGSERLGTQQPGAGQENAACKLRLTFN